VFCGIDEVSFTFAVGMLSILNASLWVLVVVKTSNEINSTVHNEAPVQYTEASVAVCCLYCRLISVYQQTVLSSESLRQAVKRLSHNLCLSFNIPELNSRKRSFICHEASFHWCPENNYITNNENSEQKSADHFT
jgi:hypothetical protein